MNVIIDTDGDLAFIRKTMDDLETGKLNRAEIMAAMALMYFHLHRCLQDQAVSHPAPPPQSTPGRIIPFPVRGHRQPLRQVRL